MTGDGDSDLSGRQDSRGSWWILTLMVLIGSSTATAAKFAVNGLPVPLLPVVRFGGAGLALLPLVWGRGAMRRLILEDGWALLAAAVLCVPVNQALFLNGAKLAPTTHVGLIYATCPIFVLAMALALRHERLEPARMIGILVCVAGAVVIACAGMGKPGRAGRSLFMGDLLLVGAVVSWAGYLTVNRRLLMRHPALPVLAATFLLGAALNLPWTLASAPEWGGRLASAGAPAWIGLAYLTLVASVLGLACQNIALRRFEASHVAAVGNLAPVLTIVWGVVLLGESITPAFLLGGALTFGGIVLASRRWSARRPSLPTATKAVPIGITAMTPLVVACSTAQQSS